MGRNMNKKAPCQKQKLNWRVPSERTNFCQRCGASLGAQTRISEMCADCERNVGAKMVLAEEVQQTIDGTTAAGVARPWSSSSTSCEQHGNTSTTKKRDRRTGASKKTATTNSGFSKTTLAGACDSTTSSCANNYTSLSEDCYSSGVDESATTEIKKNPNEEIKSRFSKWTASWKNKKPATQVIIHPNRVVEHRDLFSPNARVGASGGASSTTDERTVSLASSRTRHASTSSRATTSNYAAVGSAAQRPGGKDDEDVEFDMQLEAIAEVLMEDEDEGFHVVESKRREFPFSTNYDQDEAAGEDDFLADDAMNSATEELEPRGNSNGKQSGDGTGAATTTDASSQQDKKLRSSTTLRQSRNTYNTAAGAARKQYTPVEIVLKASKLTALRRGSRSGGTIRKLREVLHDVIHIMRAKYCSKTGDSLKDMIHSEGARKNFYSATEAAGGVSNIDQQQVEPVHLLRASKNNSSATASSNTISNFNSSSSDQSLQQQLLRLTCDSKRTASTFLHWLQRHFVLQRLPFPHSHPSGRLLTFELAPVVKSDLCVLLDNQVAAKNSNHAKNRQMPDENGVAGVCVLEQVAHTSLGLFDPVIGETISISSHCAWAAPLKSSDRLCLRSLSSCFSSSSSTTGEDFGGAGANNPLQRFVVMDVHFDYEQMNKMLANNNLREQKVEKDLPMRENNVGEINHNGPGATSSLFLSDQDEQDFLMKSNRFAALEQMEDVAKKKVVELQNQKTTDDFLDDVDARRKTVRSGQKKLKKNSFLNNGSSSAGSANTGNSACAAVAGTSTTGPSTSTGAGTSSSGGAAPQRRSQLFRGAKIVSSAISRVDVVLESDFLNPPTTMGNLEDRMICNVPLMQQQNLIFANSGCTTASSAGATSSRGSAGAMSNKTAPPAVEIGDIVLGYDLRKKVSNELEELERSGRNYPSVVLLCREMQQRNSCDESSTDDVVRDDELQGAGKTDHDEQLVPSAGAAKNEASAPRAGEVSSTATATMSLVSPSQTDIAGNTSNAHSVPSGAVTSKAESSSRAEFPTCEVRAGVENNSQNFENDQQRMLNSASSCKVESTSKDFDEIIAKHEDNPLVAGMIADLVRALEKSRR
ncbi:unnamed protein product [Amoebophrya sp. A120]|nr:unnamed protein product [Amoebophrya sp. A120]|eukprot:GSA120T00022315001.1